jgi:hypothetical protein
MYFLRVFMVLLVIGLQVGVRAQSITFAPANGTTVHKSAGMVPVSVTCSDPAGLRSTALSGGYSSVSSYYPGAPKSAVLRLYFYASYYPVGDYTFHAAAVNVTGLKTDSYITLHLVP